MSYQRDRFRNKKAREKLFTEDGWKCVYCLVDLKSLPVRLRTVEHIVPRSHGGTNKLSNLAACCHPCNSRRSNKPLRLFIGTETVIRLVRDYPRIAGAVVEAMAR